MDGSMNNDTNIEQVHSGRDESKDTPTITRPPPPPTTTMDTTTSTSSSSLHDTTKLNGINEDSVTIQDKMKDTTSESIDLIVTDPLPPQSSSAASSPDKDILSSQIDDGTKNKDEDITVVADVGELPLSPPTSPTSPSTTLRVGKRPSPWRRDTRSSISIGQQSLPSLVRDTNTTGSTTTTTSNGKKQKLQDEDVVVDKDELLMQQKKKQKQEKRRMKRIEQRQQYLCSGSIVVHIPLSITADLGIALRRGRNHRIKALYRHFPTLQRKQDEQNQVVDQRLDTLSNDKSNHKSNDSLLVPKVKEDTSKLKLRHVPQPHEYANVIDYLEAKYVQGVVISDDLNDNDGYDDNDDEDDDDENGTKSNRNIDADDEGDGSVYSESSFLDDTGLQRTIAEQVLGQTTTTKVELMSTSSNANNENDAAFFVNVGNLEVEETDLTQDMYDPINDTKQDIIKKKSRKRKKSIPEDGNSNNTSMESTNGKKSKITNSNTEVSTKVSTKELVHSPKKTIVKVEDKKPEQPVLSSPKVKKLTIDSIVTKNPIALKLQKIAARKKAEIQEFYDKLKVIIEKLTDDELPRKAKPKRTRVVVKVPQGNKPGDTITFANPHVPGQKLKVKVPANMKVGDTFKVTVPKPAEEDDDDDKPGEDGMARDHNKFNREFYDVLDDYAKTYDEWCDAEGAYRRAIDDKTFTSHYMKRNKCDDLVPLFPSDTKTSISIDYLKKVVRRARQNKHKRELTLARQQTTFISENLDEIVDDEDEDNDDNNDTTAVKSTHKIVGKTNHQQQKQEQESSDNSGDDNDDDDDDDNNNSNIKSHGLNVTSATIKNVTRKVKVTRTAYLPQFSQLYPTISFHKSDFGDVS